MCCPGSCAVGIAGGMEYPTKKAPGGRAVWEETRPTRAPDSDVAHPLLARVRVALARSPNFNATESSLQTQKHSRMAAQRVRQTSSGESVGCICDRGGRFILRRRRQLAGPVARTANQRHGMVAI